MKSRREDGRQEHGEGDNEGGGSKGRTERGRELMSKSRHIWRTESSREKSCQGNN